MLDFLPQIGTFQTSCSGCNGPQGMLVSATGRVMSAVASVT